MTSGSPRARRFRPEFITLSERIAPSTLFGAAQSSGGVDQGTDRAAATSPMDPVLICSPQVRDSPCAQ